MATGKVTGFVDSQWIINANKIDASTSGKTLLSVVPTQFKSGNFYNSANFSQFIHLVDAEGTFIFPQEAFIQTQVQAIDGVTGQTYANGAPVAFAPNFASTLFELLSLSWNKQEVETISNNAATALFFKAICNYSFDSLISGIYQMNAMILDAAGQTQNTSGYGTVGTGQQATSTFIPGAGFYTPAQKYVIAFALETSGTGPVYSVPGYGLTTATENLLAGTSNNVVFTSAAGTTTLSVASVATTPAVTGAVFATPTTTEASLTASVAAAATAGQIITSASAANSTAGGFYPILLQSNSDNTSFWLRQSLINQPGGAQAPGAGTLTNMRIYLRDILNSLAGYDNFETGGQWSLRTTPNTNLSQIFQHAQYYPGTNATAVNDAKLWMNTWTLWMPSKIPSDTVKAILDTQLVPGFSWQHAWSSVFPQDVQEITGKNFNLQFSVPEGLVDWFVIQGVPSSYLASQTNNVQCSLWNVPTDGSCLVANAQIQYQGQNFPDPFYGSDPGDNLRMYQTYLDMCDRTNYELFGPPITFQQWLYSYCYLVFDVRGRKAASTNQSQVKPTITWKTAVSVPTTVRVIAVKKQLGERYVASRVGDLSTVVVNYRNIV